jgi:hypothetical protein
VWQPIETAPRDGTRVLLFSKWEREVDFARYVGAYSSDPKGWVSIPGAYWKYPSHWAPLPESPA